MIGVSGDGLVSTQRWWGDWGQVVVGLLEPRIGEVVGVQGW